MSLARKLTLLGCLYLSQGLPYGFFTNFVPTVMRQRGASLSEIGLFTLLFLPWAFKFLWAPLVDRYGSARFGRKKTWIVTMQCCSAALFLVLSFVDNGDGYSYLLWALFFISILSATQDIATDGLAVLTLRYEERGFGNGVQVGFYRLGMIVGGGFILMLFSTLQWSGSFRLMSLMLLAATLPVLFAKEPEPPRDNGEPKSYWRLFSHFLRRRNAWLWLILIGFYKFGDAMTSNMLKPMLVDLGMNMEEIGRLLGVTASSSALVGAFVGGVLVLFVGRFPALIAFGALQAAGVAGYWLMSVGVLGLDTLYLLCAIENFTGSMANAALFTVMMDVCAPAFAASDFTLQSCVLVVAQMVSAAAGGFVAEAIGYGGNFLISAALALCGALAMFTMRRFVGAPPGGPP